MLIYKVLRLDEWEAFAQAGVTDGAPVDRRDGFVHFSTAAQLPATLAKHFAGERALMLLAVPAERLGPALRWEPSRGGQDFPHLYRPLRRADVAWSRALADGPDGPVPPAGLP